MYDEHLENLLAYEEMHSDVTDIYGNPIDEETLNELQQD